MFPTYCQIETTARVLVVLKRILALIVVLIAVIGFVANTAGLVGIWVARRTRRCLGHSYSHSAAARCHATVPGRLVMRITCSLASPPTLRSARPTRYRLPALPRYSCCCRGGISVVIVTGIAAGDINALVGNG